MDSFEKHLAANRRLVILKLLAGIAGYTTNEYLISEHLQDWHLPTSQDVVRSDMAWLHEQGLATVEIVGPVAMAKITQRGLDVSAGRSIVPGVARPVPGR